MIQRAHGVSRSARSARPWRLSRSPSDSDPLSRCCRSSTGTTLSATSSAAPGGQQYAGLLERLPDRRADQGAGAVGRDAQQAAELGRCRAGPARVGDGRIGVALVHRSAGKHAGPRRELQRLGPPQQEYFHPADPALRGGPGSPSRRRAERRAAGRPRRTHAPGRPSRAARGHASAPGLRPSAPLSRGLRRSARLPPARPAAARPPRPRCGRACPASPNTSMNSSLAPFTTCGWPLNPGALATNPSDLHDAADRVQAAGRRRGGGQGVQRAGAGQPAASWALTASPTLPVAGSFPSATGS